MDSNCGFFAGETPDAPSGAICSSRVTMLEMPACASLARIPCAAASGFPGSDKTTLTATEYDGVGLDGIAGYHDGQGNPSGSSGVRRGHVTGTFFQAIARGK